MASKGSILLVDDDRDIRDSLRIILEGNGYTVRMAANGREAMQSLEISMPDVMILDIMMSTDTEGFDLAYALRNKPQFTDLPIIILTSFLDKVREDGPDQYQHIMGESWPAKWMFEKPVDPKKLLAKIESVLSV